MNIMKKLASVFVVLAMLLSFAACDSSSKKNDDDDEDESEESGEALNNDFEGKYEGEIDLLDVYCLIFDYSEDDAEDIAKEMDKEYSVTAVFDIKEDTLDISFDYSNKDIKNFVNDFYTAGAEMMYDEAEEIEDALETAEAEEKAAEAEEKAAEDDINTDIDALDDFLSSSDRETAEDDINTDIDALDDFLSSSESDIEYEFDGESVLKLDFDGDEILEFEIDLGSKKFTVDSAECSDSEIEAFGEMFEDVTFKKVANYEGGKKDDDESKDESDDESKDENSNTSVPEMPDVSFAPVPDVSDTESSEPDVDVPVEATGIEGTYVGTVNLLDAYYVMSEFDDSVYDAQQYMTNSYALTVTVVIQNGTISLDIAEDDAVINGFVDEFAYAYIKALYPSLTDDQIQATVAQIQTEIAQDKADLKAKIEEVYLPNLSYTYGDSIEVIAVDVFGSTMNIIIMVDDTNGNFEILAIYDDEYNNSTELETLFYYTVFEKQ